MSDSHPPPRSLTGHHNLLPASHPDLGTVSPAHVVHGLAAVPPAKTLLTWTFGRGSVIWRIWPAVLIHTIFAADYDLAIPGVLLTVLGVVIGFTISYRAMSGYDRYWMGRTCWTDIIRTTRTFVRLVWVHVPITQPTASQPQAGTSEDATREREEMERRLMFEKLEALDLAWAFSVSVKHHIRGELGIYYEDLYHLVPSMHEHAHDHRHAHLTFDVPARPHQEHTEGEAVDSQTFNSPIAQQQPSTITFAEQPQTQATAASSNTDHIAGECKPNEPSSSANCEDSTNSNNLRISTSNNKDDRRGRHVVSHNPRREDSDPYIPPINAYGTFNPASHPHAPRRRRSIRSLSLSTSSSRSSSSSSSRRPGSRWYREEESTALLPASRGASSTGLNGATRDSGFLNKVSGDLIPFAITFGLLTRWWRSSQSGGDVERGDRGAGEGHPEGWAGDADDGEGGVQRLWRPHRTQAQGAPAPPGQSRGAPRTADQGQGQHHAKETLLGGKHRPRIVGGTNGENLPLEVLRRLSEWCALLESRGGVPGTTLGGMMGCLAGFEDSLCTLEKILTTPLPFVYSVHIRHTVWLYLFFLPFQLVGQFGWSTILGTGIAAFIYLGFVAAGEEIEQPFGYDENDLDLDLFCKAVIGSDIERLKKMRCANVKIGGALGAAVRGAAAAVAGGDGNNGANGGLATGGAGLVGAALGAVGAVMAS